MVLLLFLSCNLFQTPDTLNHSPYSVVIYFPRVSHMCPDWFTFPCEQRIPFTCIPVYYLIEDKAVYILIGIPVFFFSKKQPGIENTDHYFGLLPEFLLHIINTSGVEAFNKNTSIFFINAVVNCMIKYFSK